MNSFRLEKISEKNISNFNQMNFSETVMRYITGSALSTEQAIERYLKPDDGTRFGNYFVYLEETNELIGLVKIALENENIVEIGYSLLEPFWGKGYATTLAKQLVDYVKINILPKQIIGFVDERNIASQRVLEKADFQFSHKEERKLGVVSLVYKLNS